MFDLAYNWWQNKRTEQAIRAKQLEGVCKLAESLYGGQNEEDYLSLNRSSFIPRAGSYNTHRRVSLTEARVASRQLARFNAHGKNIITQIVNHTVGKGFSVKFKDPAMQKRWEELAHDIKWGKRSREIFRRIPRDGESILRKFSNGIRFVQPEDMEDSPKFKGEADGFSQSQGVVFPTEDVETVTGYFIRGEYVEADQIFHFKPPDIDMDEVRGWPLLFDIKRYLEKYEHWIEDRSLLNRFRSSVLLLRKHANATAADLQKIQQSVRDGTYTDPRGQRETSFQYMKGGRIIDTGAGEDWEFKSPNVGAHDVAEDGRAFRLLIVAGVSLPEYMVTGDASNANFASTAVAQNPGIRTMESWQQYYAVELTNFFSWLLGTDSFELSITFPSIVVKDQKKEADSFHIMLHDGIISKESWQEKVHLDPAVEAERMAKEISVPDDDF
jgi:hypothetical protein